MFYTPFFFLCLFIFSRFLTQDENTKQFQSMIVFFCSFRLFMMIFLWVVHKPMPDDVKMLERLPL